MKAQGIVEYLIVLGIIAVVVAILLVVLQPVVAPTVSSIVDGKPTIDEVDRLIWRYQNFYSACFARSEDTKMCSELAANYARS